MLALEAPVRRMPVFCGHCFTCIIERALSCSYMLGCALERI